MFRIRKTLVGHAADVKCVATCPDDSNIVYSGSRDGRILKYDLNGDGSAIPVSCVPCFVNALTFFYPKHSKQRYPGGVVLSGSSDNRIRAFDGATFNMLFELIGHENNVCCLHVNTDMDDIILSASWDNTVKVWSFLHQTCMQTLYGHSSAVWCFDFISPSRTLITGSADRTIKLWSNTDNVFKHASTLSGHSDCVRDVATLSNKEFLSCSNDTYIFWWNLDGDILKKFAGHKSFVFTLSILPDHKSFVSGADDRTIRMWSLDGTRCQIVRIPAETCWDVETLFNGDVVAACSDSTVRVFTADTERMANEILVELYENELAKSVLSPDIEGVAGLSVNSFPDMNSLKNEGSLDGDTMIINNTGKLEKYDWVSSEKRWRKIGTLAQPEHKKTVYDGRLYDYVLNVTIDDDGTSLKLPYNVDEDPGAAADRFIAQNNLNVDYKSQILQFILDNCKGAQVSKASPEGQKVSFFPQQDYVFFKSISSEKAIEKLAEFNNSLGHSDLSEVDLNIIRHSLTNEDVDMLGTAGILYTLLKKWPENKIFPILDIIRFFISNEETAVLLLSDESMKLVELMFSFIGDIVNNNLLIIRLFANLFSSRCGIEILISDQQRFLTLAHTQLFASSNQNVQIACSTLILNYCVYYFFNQENFSSFSAFFQQLVEELNKFRNDCSEEAMFRILVGIGTVMSAQNLSSVNISHFLQKCSCSNTEKLKLCASNFTELFKSTA